MASNLPELFMIVARIAQKLVICMSGLLSGGRDSDHLLSWRCLPDLRCPLTSAHRASCPRMFCVQNYSVFLFQ